MSLVALGVLCTAVALRAVAVAAAEVRTRPGRAGYLKMAFSRGRVCCRIDVSTRQLGDVDSGTVLTRRRLNAEGRRWRPPASSER